MSQKQSNSPPKIPLLFPTQYNCSPTVDDMLKNSKEILEVSRYLFSGFQFTVHNLIARKFFDSHNFHFGKIDPSVQQDDEHVDLNLAWYSFGALYKDDKNSITGRTTTNGTVNGTWSYKGDKFRWNLKGKMSKLSYGELDLAYNFYGSWLEAKFSNTSVGLGFTSPITPNTSFGAELLISPVSEIISKRYILQHKNKEKGEIYTGLLTNVTDKTELELFYSKKIKNSLRFLSALQLHRSKEEWTSNFYLGYSCKSKYIQIRALIDGQMAVSSVIEIPFSVFMGIVLSGKINYPKNDYDFGFGVTWNT